MADIDIVPKQRSNTWVWIVLAVVVILALYFLFGRSSGRTMTGALHVPAAIDAPASMDVEVT